MTWINAMNDKRTKLWRHIYIKKEVYHIHVMCSQINQWSKSNYQWEQDRWTVIMSVKGNNNKFGQFWCPFVYNSSKVYNILIYSITVLCWISHKWDSCLESRDGRGFPSYFHQVGTHRKEILTIQIIIIFQFLTFYYLDG